jgi:hypothetical protein
MLAKSSNITLGTRPQAPFMGLVPEILFIDVSDEAKKFVLPEEELLEDRGTVF